MKKFVIAILIAGNILSYVGCKFGTPSYLFVANMLNCSGCESNISSYKPEYKVYGDFLYEVVYYNDKGQSDVSEENSVRSAIRIQGLSEEGKQKEILIIPEYIDGLKVEELGRSITFLGTQGIWGKNEVLKKVYICYPIDINGPIFYNFIDVKVILFRHYSNKYDSSNPPAYLTSYNYNSEIDVINVSNSGFGYLHFANVSYFYNYENAPNDNYYWIDDYEYGEKIEFIPPEPTREGYIFDGWYKESECINKWNFEVDVLPEVKYTDVIPTHQLRNNETKDIDFRVYQETKLYAKWIEIGG